MGLSAGSLKHPRMQWNIEAAIRNAVYRSLYNENGRGYGWAFVRNSKDKVFMMVTHSRKILGGLTFYKDGEDVTDIVVKALRVSTCES